jgi:hypothetical protein
MISCGGEVREICVRFMLREESVRLDVVSLAVCGSRHGLADKLAGWGGRAGSFQMLPSAAPTCQAATEGTKLVLHN